MFFRLINYLFIVGIYIIFIKIIIVGIGGDGMWTGFVVGEKRLDVDCILGGGGESLLVFISFFLILSFILSIICSFVF